MHVFIDVNRALSFPGRDHVFLVACDVSWWCLLLKFVFFFPLFLFLFLNLVLNRARCWYVRHRHWNDCIVLKGGCGGGFWSWSRVSSFAITQICWSMLNARQVLKYWAFMTVQHRSRAQVSSCVQECHFVSLLNISSVTHMQHQNMSSAPHTHFVFSLHGVGRWALVSRYL